MDDLYKEQIVDHYKNPRNFGDLDGADVVVRESNASCGDMVEVAVKFDEEKKKIGEIKFKGVGCAISMASMSILTEEVIKLGDIDEILRIDKERMEKLLGVAVSTTREKCVMLGVRAVKKAIEEGR